MRPRGRSVLTKASFSWSLAVVYQCSMMWRIGGGQVSCRIRSAGENAVQKVRQARNVNWCVCWHSVQGDELFWCGKAKPRTVNCPVLHLKGRREESGLFFHHW